MKNTMINEKRLKFLVYYFYISLRSDRNIFHLKSGYLLFHQPQPLNEYSINKRLLKSFIFIPHVEVYTF